MSKKIKCGPYMVKDGIVAKTRPWKKIRLPHLPENMKIPCPSRLMDFIIEHDDIEQANTLKEIAWQKETILAPYRHIRNQYVKQELQKPAKCVVAGVRKIADFSRLVGHFMDRSRNDG